MGKKKQPTFAEARARLDEILAEVEDDAGDVDELAAKVKEAAELIRFCRDRLAAARHEVSQVVADLSAVEQAEEGGASEQEVAEEPDEDPSEAGQLPF